jgi:hypothetical protein
MSFLAKTHHQHQQFIYSLTSNSSLSPPSQKRSNTSLPPPLASGASPQTLLLSYTSRTDMKKNYQITNASFDNSITTNERHQLQ